MGRRRRRRKVEDVLAFGIFAPLTASIVVSKKFVMFSVLTGNTPAGVMAETALKSNAAAAKVKDSALIMFVKCSESRLKYEQ